MSWPVFILLDGVIADFWAGYTLARNVRPDCSNPHHEIGFYMGLNPVDGAIENLNEMRGCHWLDIRILTPFVHENPSCLQEKKTWLSMYFDKNFSDKLIGINPGEFFTDGYLIDDGTYYDKSDIPDDKVILFGAEDFLDWKRICNYLT